MFTACKDCTSTAKAKLCSFSFPFHTGRWAWVVCAVLLILDLALAPCSYPCTFLCWVPFNLISKSLSFLGKKRACVALLPVCVGSLTSQVGRITWFFSWWEHLVQALCSACYQMSQNAWHSYLSHSSSSFKLGLVKEFKSYCQGTDAVKILGTARKPYKRWWCSDGPKYYKILPYHR